MAILDDLIKRLKAAGQFWATDRRYQIHLDACASLGVRPDTFETFAVEVLNTPADKRAWLLSFEPIQNVEPFVRFAQYDTPIGTEMLAGLSGRKK